MEEKIRKRDINTLQKSVETLQAEAAALARKPNMTPAKMREGIKELFDRYNFNPVEELIIESQSTDDVSLATRINMFLTEFFVPKLKSVEVSGTIDHNHAVVIRRFGPGGQVIDTPAPRLGAVIDAQVVEGSN
jgi:hypothetical protein